MLMSKDKNSDVLKQPWRKCRKHNALMFHRRQLPEQTSPAQGADKRKTMVLAKRKTAPLPHFTLQIPKQNRSQTKSIPNKIDSYKQSIPHTKSISIGECTN
jgi:hypothetical protein